MTLWGRLWRCWRRGGWPLLRRITAARHALMWQRPSPWESPLRSNRQSWQLSSARFACLVCEAPAFRYGVLGLLAAIGLLFLPDTLLRALWGLPLLFGTTTSEPPPFGWPRLDPQSDTPKLVNTLNDRLGRLQQTLKLGLQWTTSTYNAGSYKRGTTGVTADDNAVAVNSCIAAAKNASIKYVFVPISIQPYTAKNVTFSLAVQMIAEGGIAPGTGADTVAYGAAWNNSQDDTSAIQAALNFGGQTLYATLGGGAAMVYGGHGVALISTTVVVPNGVIFRGFGRQATEIRIGSWTTPTPNVLVRLGAAGAGAIYNSRLENMAVNAQSTANVVNVYGEALQTQSGACNVLARAFGAAGFQTRIGTGTAPVTNNDYELVHCEALNGIAGTGIGFDLDAGTGGTFSPTLVGLSHSNASFPASLCTAGFKFQNGPFYAHRLGTEYATDGVLFSTGATGGVYGVHGNHCTNVVTHGANRIIACGVSRSGGTNTINDTTGADTPRVSAFVGYYTNSADTGGSDDGLVLARGAVHVQRTNVALAAGNNNNYTIFDYATGRLTTNAGGSAITGIQAGSPGQQMRLFKVGGAGALTITNNDANSLAANRILTPTGATITVTWCADLEYDGTTSQWRVVAFV